MSRPLLSSLAGGLAGKAPSDELEHALRRAIDAARAAWPEVHTDDATVLAHLGRALAQGAASTLDEWLARDTMSDLYLASACAAGDPAALATFEARYMSQLDAALRRLNFSQNVIDDAKQDVRIAILVGDGARPARISEFTGAGSLIGWLRVVAINAARRIFRKTGVASPPEDVDFEALLIESQHREPEFIKANYREEFRIAFQAALAKLDSRERALLRQHYILGLTIDQIAAIHGVHRATSARWLEKCRERLHANTRRRR